MTNKTIKTTGELFFEENGKLVPRKATCTWRKKNGIDKMQISVEGTDEKFCIIGIGLDKIFKRPSK